MAAAGRRSDGNGGRGRFGIRSWADAAAISSIVLLGSGVLAWGLKLEANDRDREAQLRANTAKLATIEAIINQGILPRADERTAVNERDIADLTRRFERHEDTHD